MIESPGKARVALKSGSSVAVLENGNADTLLKELDKLTANWPKPKLNKA